MLFTRFILLHFLLCCISYWLYKSDTLFTFIIFLSPFYFSFITFKFFDHKKIVVIPGKYKAALISGSAFFLSLFLTLPLVKWLPDFLSGDNFSVIIPALISFVPVFIFNKITLVNSLLFFVVSYLLSFYSIQQHYFNIFLLFGGNASFKGDTVILSFLSAYFICHLLLLLSFSLYQYWLSTSRLAK